MEKKYQDAILTGLKCGAIIAGLYLIFDFVDLIEYNLMPPHAPSYPGQIPTGFYLDVILAVVEYAVLVIAFLATGLFAIRSGEQRKNTVNHIVTIGAIAGIAAVIPPYVANIIFNIYTAAIGYPYSPLTQGGPYYQGTTTIGLGVSLGVCLSQGIIISAILSAAGAWGYAYFTKGIKHLY